MRNYAGLLRKRILLNEECEKDIHLRATALQQCKNDKIFWFDNFTYTYDPRIVPSTRPFILYPKQIKFIKWLDELLERSRRGEKVNAIGDKPRDVGATFVVMGWCLRYYLFDDFVARVGSRKEDYVDKRGETDTLFYKLDYIMERLPGWMKPDDWKKHRSYLMFGSPVSENAVSGESANPNFGRGGRKSITVFDEFGFWQWAKSSWESSGESTNFRLAVSTPPETGRDSHFYKLSVGMKGKVEKFEFDWTDVPKRDEKWLAQQKATKSEGEFQREVLKSFEGTVEGKVYALDFRFARLNEVDYIPELPLFTSWDFGLDTTAILWLQKDLATNRVHIVDSYHNSNKPIDFYVPFIKGDIESGVHKYSHGDLETIERHRNWKSATHYGDPDVKKRSLGTMLSTKDILKNKGIYIQTHDRDATDHKSIRERTKMLFRRLDINEERNEYFIDCIRNARYPERSEMSQATTEVTLPIHNWTSHFRTALEYFVDNEPSRLDEKGALLTDDYVGDAKPGVMIKGGRMGGEELLPRRKPVDWRYQ